MYPCRIALKDKGLKYDKKMEKWSAIHNTFKYFNMGRPPQFDMISKSSTWKKRIEKMTKVKNHHKNKNLSSFDYSCFKKKELDLSLEKILKKIKRDQSKAG